VNSLQKAQSFGVAVPRSSEACPLCQPLAEHYPLDQQTGAKMNALEPSDVQRSCLEVTRAAICCLCFDTATSARPVHGTAVNHFFRRYFPEDICSPSLEKLDELREVVRLRNGFWYPSSARLVCLSGHALIISPQPTQTLRRITKIKIMDSGLARLCDKISVPPLPKQSLDDWMGVPPSLAEWTSNVIRESFASLRPTIGEGRGVEVYPRWRAGKAGSSWLQVSGALDAPPNRPILCREPTSFGARRYFLAQLMNGQLVSESAVTFDPARLRYGLDLEVGRSMTYVLSEGRKTVHLMLRRSLPQGETRLLNAIALGKTSGAGYFEYTFSSEMAGDIVRALESLGLKRTSRA
jgi:hypothetical protein